jgi:hypothetical protein
MQLMIGGSDLLESISSNGAIDEELLVESRRILLAKHLIKCLRLQRKRNGMPVLKLLSLTDTLADERRREQEEEAAQRLKDVAARKSASQAKRIKEKEENLQKQRLQTKSFVDEETGETKQMFNKEEPDTRDNWEIAAEFINNSWKEGIDVDGHSIVVTAAAVNAALAGGMGNRNDLWSSESELDFSDEEIDMSRSDLRLIVTVYSPELAETASATVPTIVISQLLGAPLEHLEKDVLEKGLSQLMKYADIQITDDSKTQELLTAEKGESYKARDVDDIRQAQEKQKLRNMLEKDGKESRERTASTTSSAQSDEYGMPAALEPRLTFAIDPQLPPRKRKEFKKAGTVKVSSSPGMPTIFHRAMRIQVSFILFFNKNQFFFILLILLFLFHIFSHLN